MPRFALPCVVGSLIALASGSACRTTPSGAPAQAAAEPGTRVVCEYEKPTGSNIPVRTCYRVHDDLQRDHALDAAIDALNRPHTQGISGH